MSSLKYIGLANDTAPATQSTVDGTTFPSFTLDDVDTAINNELSGKATNTYVNNTKSSYAASSDVDTIGSGKIATSLIDQASGPASLTSGKIQASLVPTLSGGKPIVQYSLSSLTTGTRTNVIDSPYTVSSFSIPSLGYAFYPVIQGYITIGGPNGMEIQLRQGSNTGPVYARAVSDNSPNGQAISFIPSTSIASVTSSNFYLVAGTKFAGQTSVIQSPYRLTVLAIPA